MVVFATSAPITSELHFIKGATLHKQSHIHFQSIVGCFVQNTDIDKRASIFYQPTLGLTCNLAKFLGCNTSSFMVLIGTILNRLWSYPLEIQLSQSTVFPSLTFNIFGLSRLGHYKWHNSDFSIIYENLETFDHFDCSILLPFYFTFKNN